MCVYIALRTKTNVIEVNILRIILCAREKRENQLHHWVITTGATTKKKVLNIVSHDTI